MTTARRSLHALLIAFSLTGAAAALAVTAPSAWAQGDPRVEARARYMAGKQKFDAGDYRGAIADFSAADQLAPSPMNDYNIALAYERLGEPGNAVRHYRAYLNRQPTATNRAEVEASLARLDAAARGETERLSAEEAARAEAARRAEAERQAEEARRAGGGTVDVGVGAGTVVGGSYASTGDAELDRVAAVDLNAMRAAAPLPAPSARAAGAGAGGAAGAGDAPPPPVKKSKPIYKNPVFWVVVAVGIYALIVLSEDDSGGDEFRMLPEGPMPAPAAGNGGVLLRF